MQHKCHCGRGFVTLAELAYHQMVDHPDPKPSGHKVTIQTKTEMSRTRPPYPVVYFQATCTCEAKTGWVDKIGYCHGWEADHKEDVAANEGFGAALDRQLYG